MVVYPATSHSVPSSPIQNAGKLIERGEKLAVSLCDSHSLWIIWLNRNEATFIAKKPRSDSIMNDIKLPSFYGMIVGRKIELQIGAKWICNPRSTIYSYNMFSPSLAACKNFIEKFSAQKKKLELIISHHIIFWAKCMKM